jgi:hypothetical protein
MDGLVEREIETSVKNISKSSMKASTKFYTDGMCGIYSLKWFQFVLYISE